MVLGKYHYIETGSLLGVKENVQDIVIPSEEHSMKLFPLDFEEFLDALGEDILMEKICEAYDSQRPLPDYLHDKAMKLYRIYMVVGGMPQSVAEYIGGGVRKLEASELAKREILALYEKDIGKYAKGYASKVRAIFRTIPGALNSREKKFHLSALSANARMRRYEMRDGVDGQRSDAVQALRPSARRHGHGGTVRGGVREVRGLENFSIGLRDISSLASTPTLICYKTPKRGSRRIIQPRRTKCLNILSVPLVNPSMSGNTITHPLENCHKVLANSTTSASSSR